MKKKVVKPVVKKAGNKKGVDGKFVENKRGAAYRLSEVMERDKKRVPIKLNEVKKSVKKEVKKASVVTKLKKAVAVHKVVSAREAFIEGLAPILTYSSTKSSARYRLKDIERLMVKVLTEHGRLDFTGVFSIKVVDRKPKVYQLPYANCFTVAPEKKVLRIKSSERLFDILNPGYNSLTSDLAFSTKASKKYLEGYKKMPISTKVKLLKKLECSSKKK